MSTNDGGPAFPLTASTGDPRDGVYCQNGMSLRDWFVGQAMKGMITPGCVMMTEQTRNARASEAYALADAMLLARERRTS